MRGTIVRGAASGFTTVLLASLAAVSGATGQDANADRNRVATTLKERTRLELRDEPFTLSATDQASLDTLIDGAVERVFGRPSPPTPDDLAQLDAAVAKVVASLKQQGEQYASAQDGPVGGSGTFGLGGLLAKSRSAKTQMTQGITLVGCIQPEEAPKTGFVVVDASAVDKAASGAASAGATGAAAASASAGAGGSGTTYEVEGESESGLRSYVGQRVEIVGVTEGHSRSTTSGSAVSGITAPARASEMRRIEITSLRAVSGTCTVDGGRQTSPQQQQGQQQQAAPRPQPQTVRESSVGSGSGANTMSTPPAPDGSAIRTSSPQLQPGSAKPPAGGAARRPELPRSVFQRALDSICPGFYPVC